MASAPPDPDHSIPLFRDNAYLREEKSVVVDVNDRGGIMLSHSLFYPTGGGQPGDNGQLTLPDGGQCTIATTVYGDSKADIILVPADNQPLPAIGDAVQMELDWRRRLRLMRMHTALHLLSAVLPFAVTGGSIGADESRLDFDIPDEIPDKVEVTEKVNDLIAGNHAISSRWITDAELDANPGLVKTMSVKPPRGSGFIRLISIGDIDLQPCGGTHVATTGEIGPIIVRKIEKKGRQNRRVRIRFADEWEPA
jgi:misacylated tRNA(Ala) deacylase